MGPQQIIIELGVITTKGFSTFLKAPKLELHSQMQFNIIPKKNSLGVYAEVQLACSVAPANWAETMLHFNSYWERLCLVLNIILYNNICLFIFSYLAAGVRICWLYPLQRDKTSTQRGVLGITLNCIWWWGSNSESLGSVRYHFIYITPSFTLTLNDSTC